MFSSRSYWFHLFLRSGALIGVAYVDIAMPDLDENLIKSRLYDHSEWGVLSFADGRVLSDSLHSTSGVNVSNGNSINVTWSDLGIISSQSFAAIRDSYEALLRTKWTNETLAAVAEDTTRECFYGVATAYPLPYPPSQFDPNYAPYALAVQVVGLDAYAPIEQFESSIDSDVLKGSFAATGIALFGMFFILLMLWCVARFLTQPLLWMETVSWRIVNHGDTRSGGLQLEDEVALTATVRCSPRTEITELVEEFRSMITGFSGGGASSVAESEANEIRNILTWHSDFQQLYTTASVHKSIRSSITANTPSTEPEDCNSGPSSEPNEEKGNHDEEAKPDQPVSTTVNEQKALKAFSNTVFPAPPKKHVGPVVASLPEEGPKDLEGGREVYRSRLFCWIVLLIVIPLLVTNTIITAIVTQAMIDTVPAWVDDLNQVSYDLEMQAYESIVMSKATLVGMILASPGRDLYWIARMASWLHFGAVPRADSFTELQTASDECKSSDIYKCDLLLSDAYQCPCDWDDTFEPIRSCTEEFDRHESRRRQARFYSVLELDMDPLTGGRLNVTSFPASPEETIWNYNASELPGAEKGANAAGFETTYDRLRVSSALAVVEFPLFNYRNAAGYERQILGSFIGFEADGMFSGFTGCSHVHSTTSFFVSDEGNKAFLIAPELCPEGKYGFDPRCRDWYSTTRKSSTLHMTAPYLFGPSGPVGLSIATPVVNPIDGDFVGVMLLDYPHKLLEEAFHSLSFPISFLVTPGIDIYEGDVVVGTNKSKTWNSSKITDELFENHGNRPQDKDGFEKGVLASMKAGQHGLATFTRQTKDGEEEELVAAYAAVNQTILASLDPSRLDMGVTTRTETMYSVAIVNFARDIRRSFEEVEETMYGDLDRLAIIDAVIILVLSIVFLFVVCKVRMTPYIGFGNFGISKFSSFYGVGDNSCNPTNDYASKSRSEHQLH